MVVRNHKTLKKIRLFLSRFFSKQNSSCGCDIVRSHLRVCFWGVYKWKFKGGCHKNLIWSKLRSVTTCVKSLLVQHFHLMKLLQSKNAIWNVRSQFCHIRTNFRELYFFYCAHVLLIMVTYWWVHVRCNII